ncbi:MAG: hypothetical protein WCV79_02810 [Candidatus Paceibacterota bacterium]|jgi:hypothetical protein
MKIINPRKAVQGLYGSTRDSRVFLEAMGVESDSIPKRQWMFIRRQLINKLQEYFIKWLVDNGHIHIGMVRNNQGSIETLQRISEGRLVWKDEKGRAISGRNVIELFSELWDSLPEE